MLVQVCELCNYIENVDKYGHCLNCVARVMCSAVGEADKKTNKQLKYAKYIPDIVDIMEEYGWDYEEVIETYKCSAWLECGLHIDVRNSLCKHCEDYLSKGGSGCFSKSEESESDYDSETDSSSSFNSDTSSSIESESSSDWYSDSFTSSED